MSKFVKEFTKAYKKNTKAATKWVSRNPGKAIAINAVGDCGLVAIGAAVAIKAMKKKNPLTIEKKEKKEFFLKRIFKKKETPTTPETPAAPAAPETETSTEAPAPAES